MLRISNRQITANFNNQVFANKSQLEIVRQQITTGVEVGKPSDNPAQVNTIVKFNRVVQRITRHEDRIASVLSGMRAQEVTLDSTESIMVRAKELAEQAANGSLDVDQRKQLAVEVFELRDALVGLANTKYRGAYIFAGLDDNDAPYEEDVYTNPAVAGDPAASRWVWVGDDGADQTREVTISESDTIRVITSGDQIFSEAIATLERLGRSLDGYETTPTDLSTLPDGGGLPFNFPADSPAQVADIREMIDGLDTVLKNNIIRERMDLGSRMNSLEIALDVNVEVRFSTEEYRSLIQDADAVEAASTFANLQLGLEALLITGTRINELTLLNYL